MKSKYLLPSALLAMSACVMPLTPARADVVLANSVGFIKGQQIFTDTFHITTPGTLTVNLTTIAWLDTLTNLNCFLTSPRGGLFGASVNGTSETMKVGPGDISVNWFGIAAGTFDVGVYAIKVDFQAANAPVPVPASLPLLLSGLGALSVWWRKRRSVQPAC
jgi:hypothetical protein